MSETSNWPKQQRPIAADVADPFGKLAREARTRGRRRASRHALRTAASERIGDVKRRDRKVPKRVLWAAETILHAAYGTLNEKTVLGLDANDAERIARLGLDALSRQDVPQAKAYGELATFASDGCFLGWVVRGAAAARSRDDEGAVAAYRKALAIEPRYIEGWVDLAEVLVTAAKLVDASKALEVARSLDPHGKTDAGKRAKLLIMSTLFELQGR